LVENKGMKHRPEDIEIQLIKLEGGSRVLRLNDAASGLCLQRELDPKKAVRAQKEILMTVFQAALAKADMLGG
jgi:hypothetical protein